MKFTKPLALLVGLGLAASFAGCSGNNSSGVTATAGSSYSSTVDQGAGANATAFEFWTFVELHGKFYETMAGKWNAQHPDKQVKINVNVMPYDDMHNKLQLALNAGEGVPDIVDIEVGKFPNFTAGTPQLMDLTQVAAPYAKDIVPARMKLYQMNGKQYGLPTHVGAMLAYYNTDLLTAAGVDYTTIKTWDDFKAAGAKYVAATGKPFSTADTSAMWQISLLLGQNGSDYLTADGKLQVNNDTMAKGYQMLKDMQDAGVLKTIDGGQPDTEQAYGLINSGEYAAVVMPEWFMSRYPAYMPDLAGKVAIAAPPVNADAKYKTIGQGGTGTAVPLKGKNPEAAAEFLAYAKLSVDGATEIWNSLGFDPTNMALWSNQAVTHDPNNAFNKYFKNNVFDVLNTFKDSIGFLQSQTFQAMPNVNNAFGTTVQNEIFENGADIKATLDQAQADLKNELGQ
ncbi:MAG: extracellular solute-binding protein [Propionibacteriaceae bacterium]|jgi:arabinosaccharide transport system substrate-binding protein|nr:extracellular solute-binding protein [Propionibacteriaceae bacterium]